MWRALHIIYVYVHVHRMKIEVESDGEMSNLARRSKENVPAIDLTLSSSASEREVESASGLELESDVLLAGSESTSMRYDAPSAFWHACM